MRKWVILIVVISLGGVIFGTWLEQRKNAVVGNILNSVQLIDSIRVKDGESKEEILTFTKLDPSFFDMVEIYKLPYKDLKWSERKLLKEKPFIEVEYLQNNEINYIVSIYQLNDENMSMLVNISDPLSYRYMYTSKENNTTYIFAIKENYQLLGVNEGFKELLDIINSK